MQLLLSPSKFFPSAQEATEVVVQNDIIRGLDSKVTDGEDLIGWEAVREQRLTDQLQPHGQVCVDTQARFSPLPYDDGRGETRVALGKGMLNVADIGHRIVIRKSCGQIEHLTLDAPRF